MAIPAKEVLMKRMFAVLSPSLLTLAAGAQTYTFPYACTQRVTMTPPVNSRWDYVAAKQFTHCHAWYFSTPSGTTYEPRPQNPGFHAYGIDQRWNQGWYSFCIQPCQQASVPLVMRTTYIDPYTGTGPAGLSLQSSLPSIARAEALSRVTTDPSGHGLPLTASVHASGFRQSMPFGFWSRSFALTEVEAKAWVPGRPPSGSGGFRIIWSPQHARVSAVYPWSLFRPWMPPTPQSQTFRLFDPIEVSVVDRDGETQSQTLLDMFIDLHDAGEVEINEGEVRWDAPDADLVLTWGAFGSGTGHVILSCRGGRVVESSSSNPNLPASPPVGTPVPFSFVLPTLDLDMPLHRLVGYPYEVTIGTSDGSSAPITEPSCPADWNLDGFLDFFDYDAFVACFEDPSVCGWRGTADFNADGFADFFDYDDFVSAYERGC
jgi:hypothetical protein